MPFCAIYRRLRYNRVCSEQKVARFLKAFESNFCFLNGDIEFDEIQSIIFSRWEANDSLMVNLLPAWRVYAHYCFFLLEAAANQLALFWAPRVHWSGEIFSIRIIRIKLFPRNVDFEGRISILSGTSQSPSLVICNHFKEMFWLTFVKLTNLCNSALVPLSIWQ